MVAIVNRSSLLTRRQLVGLLVLGVFLVPAWVMAAVVAANGAEAKPHVEALHMRAEAEGVEIMPGAVFDVEMAPPEQVPPGAIEQDAFLDHAREVFHGNPVDAAVLYWPLLIAVVFVLTVWALAGLAISGALGGRLGAAGALVTIATAGVLWAPLLYYRDVIDVVTYYID